jgi:glycine/D-amino acid oxidase-like deaminating enzyme
VSNSFDVIVVGLGVMGAASAYQLTKCGVKMLGIDRFAPSHQFAASARHRRTVPAGMESVYRRKQADCGRIIRRFASPPATNGNDHK